MRFAFLLLTACSPAPATTVAPEVPDPVPGCLVLAEGPVQLPETDLRVDAGARVTVPVELRNDCAGELIIEGVTLGGEELSLAAHTDGPIPAGQARTLEIVWEPRGPREILETLRIDSNDPDRRTLDVPVLGRALAPRIAFYPALLDLGAPAVGCDARGSIRVYNSGNVPLTITDLDASGTAADRFDVSAVLPATLQPQATDPEAAVTVRVVKRTLSADVETLALQLSSSDPMAPLAGATVQAGGTRDLITERWDTIPQRQLDLLVVVNHESRGFDGDLEATLVDGVAHMRDSLEDLGVDYRLGLAVSDDGCLLGSEPFVDATATDARATWEAMLDRDYSLHPYSSDGEHVLARATAALAPESVEPGGCNEGLNRRDAGLGIIFVTEEPDQSPSVPKIYVDALVDLKSDPGLVTLHTVGSVPPDSCYGMSLSTGLLEASRRTGGLTQAICAVEPDDLGRMAGATPLPAYGVSLQHTPVIETVQVTIDGTRTLTGWTAITEPVPRVVFDADAVPKAGQAIEVTYDRASVCR